MTRADALRAQLPEMGEALAAAFETLHRSPHADSCELLAIWLQGAAQHVLSLRAAVMEGQRPDGA